MEGYFPSSESVVSDFSPVVSSSPELSPELSGGDSITGVFMQGFGQAGSRCPYPPQFAQVVLVGSTGVDEKHCFP